MNVIPAIDLKDGRCVRLFQGDFARQTEYSADPGEIARQFADLAATDLHLVDLDGAQSGTQINRDIIAGIAAESRFAVQLGGGIRDADTLDGWFSAGVDRCVIGSLAITEPDTVKSWLIRFGADRIVLALDVVLADDGMPMITTHGWTRRSDTSLYECIEDFGQAGLTQVLCTDVSRDGAMSGPNVDLYGDILARFPDIVLQASGGVRDVGDLRTLRGIGVPAAIVGRALLDGKITAEELASFQHDA